jgi:hypothetical protein
MGAPVQRITYLARRNPRWSRQEWLPRWREHWRLAAGMEGSATVRRYVQCAVLETVGEGDYDCVATAEYVSAAARTANRGNAEYHRIMRADEVEVFDTLIENCSFIGTHRVLAGTGAGPFKVVRFVRRRPGVAPERLAREWGGLHAERILASSSRIRGYAQDIADVPERPGGWGLDVEGTEEIWFDDLRDAIGYARSGALRRIDGSVGLVCAVAQVVTDEFVLKG